MNSKSVLTVGELIDKLQGFPRDLPVIVKGYESGFDYAAAELKAVRVRDASNDPLPPDEWSGTLELADSRQDGVFSAVLLAKAEEE